MINKFKNLSSKTKIIIIALAIPIAVGGAAFGYWTLSPLFYDRVVNESLEDAIRNSTATSNDTSAGGSVETVSTTSQNANSTTSVIGAGNFVDADAAHHASGVARYIDIGGGQRILRFEDGFETTNGPDLYIWLTKDGNPDNGYVDLGVIKGNIGAQNYEIPADVDLEEYDTVIIWCLAFAVLFGSAEIAVPDAATSEMAFEVLSTGTFVDADAAHKASGTANYIDLGGGNRIVRFEDGFETTNGPDLYIWLTKDGNPDNGYVDLGVIKGNIGAQNYEIPADVDLEEYDTVIIWCLAFSVLFGTAELSMLN